MNTQPSAVRVDIVSDVVCPWCAIGYYQLAAASREASVALDIHWHPFELNPHMVPEGENLREHLAAKYGTTPEGSKKARANLTAIGAELGFTFNYADDMRMVNTFRAHQLIHWAQTHSRGHEMKLALFSAFFTDRRDLNDPLVLGTCAGHIGLDRDEALRVLEESRYAQQVREAEQRWVARGIQGVPAMIFDKRFLISGAQGVENYTHVLRQIASEEAA